MHKDKLAKMKPNVDNKAPPRYNHLVVNAKKAQNEEDRLTEIEHQNRRVGCAIPTRASCTSSRRRCPPTRLPAYPPTYIHLLEKRTETRVVYMTCVRTLDSLDSSTVDTLSVPCCAVLLRAVRESQSCARGVKW